VKTNTWTWVALLALTLTSFTARGTVPSQAATTIVLAAAGVKCSALGWNFMDLRSASWFWRAALLILIATLLLPVRAVILSPR
jgi:hypothetical protein